MPRIYFGKLPSYATTYDIEKLVDGYGCYRDLVAHGTYAFVEFERMRDAEYAISRLNGTIYMDKRIVVEFANGNRNRSPIRRRSNSPSYYYRRRTRSRSIPRHRYRYHSPSRSRSPAPRCRPPRSPSTPPPVPVRRRKISLGSLEDGEIRSSVSSTASDVAANVRKLDKCSKQSVNRVVREPSVVSSSSSTVNMHIQHKDELPSTQSATPLVSPKHTPPSDYEKLTPPHVKASPRTPKKNSNDQVDAPRRGRRRENGHKDITTELRHGRKLIKRRSTAAFNSKRDDGNESDASSSSNSSSDSSDSSNSSDSSTSSGSSSDSTSVASDK